MEGRFTTAFTLLAPIILAFAFRRIAGWRDTWLPTLAAIPASIVVGILFSGLGDGAATRATTLTWTLWAAFVGFRLLQKHPGQSQNPSDRRGTGPNPCTAQTGAVDRHVGGSAVALARRGDSLPSLEGVHARSLPPRTHRGADSWPSIIWPFEPS
jgi:hypothetical protein